MDIVGTWEGIELYYMKYYEGLRFKKNVAANSLI